MKVCERQSERARERVREAAGERVRKENIEVARK